MPALVAKGLTQRLLTLSRNLGREDRKLAILGEGNASARMSPTTFVVKASGSNLASLSSDGLTECRFEGLLPLLEQNGICLLYTSPSPRDRTRSRMPSSA